MPAAGWERVDVVVERGRALRHRTRSIVVRVEQPSLLLSW